jgi:hypothetical protein
MRIIFDDGNGNRTEREGENFKDCLYCLIQAIQHEEEICLIDMLKEILYYYLSVSEADGELGVDDTKLWELMKKIAK